MPIERFPECLKGVKRKITSILFGLTSGQLANNEQPGNLHFALGILKKKTVFSSGSVIFTASNYLDTPLLFPTTGHVHLAPMLARLCTCLWPY